MFTRRILGRKLQFLINENEESALLVIEEVVLWRTQFPVEGLVFEHGIE